MLICPEHGEQEGSGIVCISCFNRQTERVERESLPLRLANTATALREHVVRQQAEQNGHAE